MEPHELAMNSLRYLVSPEEKRSSSSTSPTASALRLEQAQRSAPIIWRLVMLLFSLLRFGKPPKDSAKGSISSTQATQGNVRKHGRAKKVRANSSSSALPPIPRLFAKREKKLLVLDLDETLVHSMTRGNPRASQLVEVHLRNSPMASFYYVAKRPFCSDFLTAVLQWYDVAVFTASVCEYADPIIDLIEHDLGRRCFKRRLYRDSCIPDGKGGYIKDLRVLEQDLSRILLVDNSPISFARQQCNGLAIEGWISDPSDRTLLQMLPLLFALRHTSDVRSILSLHDSSKIAVN